MAIRVSQCCCGFTLKTGSIIIGVLSALGCFLENEDGLKSFGTFIVLPINLILSVMLVYGANYDKPGLVKPWVHFTNVYLILVSVMYFNRTIEMFVHVSEEAGVIMLLASFMYIACLSYFIIVVNSFHYELKEARSNHQQGIGVERRDS